MRTVEIGGKERQVFFGMNALRLFCNVYEITLADLSEAFNELTFDQSLYMVTIALKEGARKAKTKEKFTIEQVSDWLDEGFEDLGPIIEAVMETMPFKAKEEGEEPAKVSEKEKKQ